MEETNKISMDGKFIAAYTGALGLANDIPTILRAANRLRDHKDIHFLLVGDGDLQGPMQAQARRWGLAHNVHFAGLRHDVPRLLQAADAFVLSSRREGLPGVVLEALAAGLPVVATDLPGVREIAAHTGLIRIVPCEDAPALAREILRTRDDILQGGIAPEPFPVAFDLQRCAAQLLDIYREQARR